jgi:hypothetical protein
MVAVRMRKIALKYARGLAIAMAAFSTVACGNGGSINFQPGVLPTFNNRGAATTSVPASSALWIESGKTTANGYHAKVQINPVKGTQLTGGGYEVKMKHTVRNR